MRPTGHWRAAIKQRGVLGQQVGGLNYALQHICQYHVGLVSYQTRSYLLTGTPRKPSRPRNSQERSSVTLSGPQMAQTWLLRLLGPPGKVSKAPDFLGLLNLVNFY